LSCFALGSALNSFALQYGAIVLFGIARLVAPDLAQQGYAQALEIVGLTPQ